MQLVAGQRQSLIVGELPRVIAQYMGCNPGVVYLGHKEAIKIVRKHSTVRVEQLQSLPYALRDGEYRADPVRRGPITVYYQGEYDQQLYVIGIKGCAKGGEAWISTLFLCSERNAHNQRARGKLLKSRVLRK